MVFYCNLRVCVNSSVSCVLMTPESKLFIISKFVPTPPPPHFTCPCNVIYFKKDTLLLLRFLGHLFTRCELLRLEKSCQIARKMIEEKITCLPSSKFCQQLTLLAEPACSFAYDLQGSKLCTPVTLLILWQDLSKFYTSNFPTPLILSTI